MLQHTHIMACCLAQRLVVRLAVSVMAGNHSCPAPDLRTVRYDMITRLPA